VLPVDVLPVDPLPVVAPGSVGWPGLAELVGVVDVPAPGV
jgi:hypothetical protein